MPETVAVWLATNTAITSAGYIATVGQLTALTTAAFAAASIGYGNHQRRKQQRAARDAFNASVQDRLVMTATAQAARSRVYGRVRNVDGVVFKATHGVNQEFYTLVIAVAGHQVDAIEEVWFDDKPVTLDGSGNVTSAPYSITTRDSLTVTMPVSSGSGSVVLPGVPVAGTTPVAVFTTNPGTDSATDITLAGSLAGTTFSVTGAPIDGDWRVQVQIETTSSKARVRAYTGAPGQNLYGDLTALVGSAVQSTDRFEGVACLLVTLTFDQDAFPGGVPSITAVMRGARVFDPRSSVTAWTENPALIARDWALYAYGGGCVTAEINEPSFAAAANACDVSTSFALPSGGPEVRPLYQAGIVIPLDSNPDEALSEICEAMAGQWGWAGGRLSVRAGVYRAPVATITEDWVTSAEAIQVTPGATTAEAINISRPTYADAAQGWVQTPGPEVRADAYVAADGRDLPTELQLGGVTRAVHAQHVCGVLLREAREGLTLTLPCNLRAYPLELFDVVSVTLPRFGWAGKLFEVMGWRFSLTGGVLLTLRETAAALYTPDAVFDLLGASPNTGLPRPTAPPAITGLAATSGGTAQIDGSSMARIRVTWDPVASEAVRQSGGVEVQVAEVYGGLPTGDWPTIAPLAGRAVAADVFGQRIGRLVAIRARAVNTLGMRGPWRQIVHTVSGRRAPVVWRQASAPSGASVQDQDEWVDTDDSNRRYLRLAGAWVDVRDVAANTAIVYLFRRAASTPAVPAGTLTYTFATNALSGSLDGWSTAVPAGSDPVYVTVATASSANASDSIAPGEWAAPVVLAANGAAGAPGSPGATGSTGPAGAAGTNAATVYLFQRTGSATAPALPSASVTYTFASGAAAGVNNGWQQSLPTTGGAYRWLTTATALGTGATDTIAAGEWAAASLLAEDGLSVFVGEVFIQVAGTPSAPSGGTFNFTTATLTPPAGWSTTRPAPGTENTWAARFSFAAPTPGATVTAGTWGTPVIVQPGTAGPEPLPGNFFITDQTIAPTDASAAVVFNRNGSISQLVGVPSSSSVIGNWHMPNGTTVGDAYEVRFDLLSSSGSTGGSSGTVGAWQVLSSNRSITLDTTENTNTFRERIYSYTVRLTSSGATVSSGQISLLALVEV